MSDRAVELAAVWISWSRVVPRLVASVGTGLVVKRFVFTIMAKPRIDHKILQKNIAADRYLTFFIFGFRSKVSLCTELYCSTTRHASI